MKKLYVPLSLVFILILAFSCSGEMSYDLTGSWSVENEMYSESHGFIQNTFEEGFVITEQKGHVFKGYKIYVNALDKEEYTENFSGTVSVYGDILIAEHEDGILSGVVENRNSIILQYAENGDIPKVQYIKLNRIEQ
ncbi:MAG: hypothetical protein R6V48_08075 [Fidelibacterota bacterium]